MLAEELVVLKAAEAAAIDRINEETRNSNADSALKSASRQRSRSSDWENHSSDWENDSSEIKWSDRFLHMDDIHTKEEDSSLNNCDSGPVFGPVNCSFECGIEDVL